MVAVNIDDEFEGSKEERSRIEGLGEEDRYEERERNRKTKR